MQQLRHDSLWINFSAVNLLSLALAAKLRPSSSLTKIGKRGLAVLSDWMANFLMHSTAHRLLLHGLHLTPGCDETYLYFLTVSRPVANPNR